MSQKPIDAPEHCPGPESKIAGTSDSCAGCPNQSICAAGPQPVDPALTLIDQAMDRIEKKILVLSGKGGVGKSTVSANLAWFLSSAEDSIDTNPECNVGLLDLDITGPSIPMMMGVLGEQVFQSNSGWSPIYLSDTLSVMSIGFMLPNPDSAIIWRGPKKNGLIKQFLKDVDWGDLKYMIIDTPPGTSDEHLSIVQYLRETGIHGAVVVTTPMEVSLADVGIPIIGVIENMNGFVCPNCTETSFIFAADSGGAQKMAKEMNVPFLGSIPIDPRIAKSCDLGLNIFEKYPDSPAVQVYREIIQKIKIF